MSDIEKMKNDFLKSPQGGKLSAKQGELDKLLRSADGQRIKSLVQNDAGSLEKAVNDGDMDTLQGALKSILQTQEGMRLAKQLKDIMK